jgi:predicted DNA-binding protein with PD1-like motif
MRSQRLGGGAVRHVLVFEKGDEFVEQLLAFARREKLTAGSFTGIGAFSDVVLGFFERERKDYKRIPLAEQVEVLTLAGDITLKDADPQVHAHVVVGKADGTAWGGHLLEGHVWPTLELVVVESPAELRRTVDDETRLPLISLEPEKR